MSGKALAWRCRYELTHGIWSEPDSDDLLIRMGQSERGTNEGEWRVFVRSIVRTRYGRSYVAYVGQWT